MKTNKDYTFKSIEEYAEKNNFNFIEHGDFIIGESFIVLKHNEKDITISFVLISVTNTNGFFKCIYSDV